MEELAGAEQHGDDVVFLPQPQCDVVGDDRRAGARRFMDDEQNRLARRIQTLPIEGQRLGDADWHAALQRGRKQGNDRAG